MPGLTLRRDSLHAPDNETPASSSARTAPSITSKGAHFHSGWPTGTSRVAAHVSSSVATKGTDRFDAGADSDIWVYLSSSSTHAFSSPFYEHVMKERHCLAFADDILAELDDDFSDEED